MSFSAATVPARATGAPVALGLDIVLLVILPL
jgi:hypothetical protein